MEHERKPTALGLRRGIVELKSHHAEWRHAFHEERERLAEVIASDAYRLEHIGSTSVPGLAAKPILDLALLIPQAEPTRKLRNGLHSKGYIYGGNKGQSGGYLFVLETCPDVRTVHLHAISNGDPQWDAYLTFRDALRTNAGLRQRYALLKARLVAEFSDDRAAYTASKASFIQSVLHAKSWSTFNR